MRCSGLLTTVKSLSAAQAVRLTCLQYMPYNAVYLGVYGRVHYFNVNNG
jgi:hypothetical protein